jgi:ribosomal protein L7Ae-like RNA K-turn-binding protein
MMQMKNEKIFSLLGLARRAGRICWQEEANLAAIRSGRAKLLLLAGDAGRATVKKYRDKSRYYRVPVAIFADKATLGRALGTTPRAAVTVLDEGFARQITRELCE